MEGAMKLIISNCDVIVLVVAQMPDLFTSPVSLHMQKPKVCRLVI
jgi:hypothetical protein